MPALEPLRVELSADELAVLAQQLGTKVQSQGEAPMSAERQAVAVQSLQRRGLMNVLPDGTVQLDNLVGALLGTCVYPSFIIAVRQTSPRGTVSWSIHLLGEMAVEQRHLEDERYLFIAYAAAGRVLQRMSSMLNVGEQPRPAGELIALERTVLQAARAAAGGGTLHQSVEALNAGDVPVETSQSIVQLLSSFEEVAECSRSNMHPGRGTSGS